MAYSPPKKATLIMSLILEIIGIIIGLMGLYGYCTIIPINIGMDINQICVILGFVLTLIGWFILYLGVKLRGF
ncbi:MAG: hypothetical protein ACTSUT_01375 [Promethearchaeota archaeon]